MYQWLVIGISGVTCGGKTSLTFRLRDLLIQYLQSRKQIVKVVTLSQDDYFLKPDDPRHVLLPSLGHFNWDIPTAVDFNGLYEAAVKLTSVSPEGKGELLAGSDMMGKPLKESRGSLRGVLIIEGFLIFNHRPTSALCHLKYYLLLSRAVCASRRVLRTYDPPDVPGYFDQCIWPEHVKHRKEILGKGKVVDESDPLTFNELKECIEEGKIVRNEIDANSLMADEISPSVMSGIVTQTKSKETCDIGTTWSQDAACNKGFYMRVGGGVSPLTTFGAAGLGMVNNIKALNGGVVDKETTAQLVFKDVITEIETHEMVAQDVTS